MMPASPPAVKSRSFALLFRKNAARSRVAAATKPWITAQLRLYSIEFKSTDDKNALWDTLEAAFKSKKCQKSTLEVDAIEESLRRKYAVNLEAHSKEVKLWEDREFAERAQFGPSSEFFADKTRFMNKYFLDSNGNPDRSKTVKPILLKCDAGTVKSAITKIPGLVAHGWRDCWFYIGSKTLLGWETEMDRAVEHEFLKVASSTPPDLTGVMYFPVDMHGAASAKKSSTLIRLLPHFDNGHLLAEAATRIADLHVHPVKGRYNRNHTIIGRDATEIMAEIARIEKGKEEYDLRMKEQKQRYEAERAARELKQEKEDWERFSKPHREYIASRKPTPGPLTLQDLTGSWIVRGEKELAFRERGVLSLETFPAKSTHGVIASFEFECVAGTMLLGLSRRSVDLLREEQPKRDEESDDLDDESGNISGGYGFGGGSSFPTNFTTRTATDPSTGQERSVGASPSAGQKRELGAVADPWRVQAAMAKRQKMKAESHDDIGPLTAAPTPRALDEVCVKEEPQDRQPTQPPAALTSNTPAPIQDTHSTRVHYQFGYSDTNWYDPEECKKDENLGYFDFDSSRVSAKGAFVLESWWGAEGEPLSLFKVADRPKSRFSDGSDATPKEWYMYDGRGRGSRW
ncbi:hypothetical protein V8F33_002271 [Rhypophila sp. PSN 637]